ncbi:MAG: D-tyrosyl-tRNA(Tyr) deacylase, partial [Firmicutes bacterium]|nr:D-tyrosyl-tRNA(Tyr) deacylase [Bacillota bacterium]
MIAVLQRVHSASVSFDGSVVGQCGYGLMIMLGIATDDDEGDARTLIDKILKLRIFRDGDGRLNLSVRDVGGEVLVISNFTLMANCYRGTRPDYSHAAHCEVSLPLYNYFIDEICRRGVHAEHG